MSRYIYNIQKFFFFSISRWKHSFMQSMARKSEKIQSFPSYICTSISLFSSVLLYLCSFSFVHFLCDKTKELKALFNKRITHILKLWNKKHRFFYKELNIIIIIIIITKRKYDISFFHHNATDNFVSTISNFRNLKTVNLQCLFFLHIQYLKYEILKVSQI